MSRKIWAEKRALSRRIPMTPVLSPRRMRVVLTSRGMNARPRLRLETALMKVQGTNELLVHDLAQERDALAKERVDRAAQTQQLTDRLAALEAKVTNMAPPPPPPPPPEAVAPTKGAKAAAATTATAIAATATAATILTRTSFIDGQVAALEFKIIEFFHARLGLFIG